MTHVFPRVIIKILSMQISKEINQNHAKIQRTNKSNGKIITNVRERKREGANEKEDERHFKSSLTHTASVYVIRFN